MSKRNKYYKKIYRMVFGVIFAIFLIVSTIISFSKIQSLKDDFMQEHNEILNHTATEIEETIDVAYSVSRNVLRDELLIEYCKEEEKNHIYMLQLSDKMLKNWYSIFSKNNFNMGVCRYEHNAVIRPGSISTIDDFWNEINASAKDRERIESYAADDNAKNWKSAVSFFTEDAVGIAHFVIVTKDATNKEVLFVIDINLDKIIKTDSNVEGYIIQSKNAIYNSSQYVEKFNIEDIGSYNQISTSTYGSEDAVMFAATSDDSVRKYLYAVDTSLLHEEYYGAISLFLFFLTMSFLLSLLLAFFATRYLYGPIKRIYNIFSEKDFDENAFDNIQVTLMEKRKIDKNLFLKDILLGKLKEDTSSELLRHSLHWLKSDIEFIMFEIVNYIDMQSKYELCDMNERIEAAIDMVNSFSNEICFEIINMDTGKFVYLGKQTNEGLIENLNTILYKISEETQLKVVAVAGKVSDVSQISTAYTDAYMLLETSEFVSNRHIFRLSESKKIEMQLYYYPLDYEKMIIQYTVKGEMKSVVDLLDELLNENLIKRNLEGEALMRFFYAIIATIGRILQIIKKDEQEVFGEGKTVYFKMKMCSTKQEMRQRIIEMFTALCDNVISQKNSTDIEFAEKLKEYVHQNYNNDISLLDLSQEFGLSVNYICSLFKDVVSRNFKDYLNMYRINEAKKQMQADDAKISEIAQNVGFNSANTFIRCFKRYEGITPKRFMELNTEE